MDTDVGKPCDVRPRRRCAATSRLGKGGASPSRCIPPKQGAFAPRCIPRRGSAAPLPRPTPKTLALWKPRQGFRTPTPTPRNPTRFLRPGPPLRRLEGGQAFAPDTTSRSLAPAPAPPFAALRRGRPELSRPGTLDDRLAGQSRLAFRRHAPRWSDVAAGATHPAAFMGAA